MPKSVILGNDLNLRCLLIFWRVSSHASSPQHESTLAKGHGRGDTQGPGVFRPCPRFPLELLGRRGDTLSLEANRKKSRDEAKARPTAGDARPIDLEGAQPRADARVRRRPADSAARRRDADGRGGHALP